MQRQLALRLELTIAPTNAGYGQLGMNEEACRRNALAKPREVGSRRKAMTNAMVVERLLVTRSECAVDDPNEVARPAALLMALSNSSAMRLRGQMP